MSWEKQGASRLHLVDLDGAKTGKLVNAVSIKKIINTLKIPVQLGGGIRSYEQAESLIQLGLDRVILGTIAIEEPELVIRLSKKYPYKIAIGIDSKKGLVATRGWLTHSKISACELTQKFSDLPLAAIITTDIETDGTLKGPNLNYLREIANLSQVPVIASGGIGSMSDLISLIGLEESGVTGVIVGRALYDGTIALGEAIKILKNSDRFDVKNNATYIA